MLRKSVLPSQPAFLVAHEQRRCLWIANLVLFQCVLVFVVGWSIISCTWRPDLLNFDTYKLASIMYLYDKGVCEIDNPHKDVKSIQRLQLNTDTKGFNVLPIKWEPVQVIVSARISEKTRNYTKLSMACHLIWVLLTIPFIWIVKSNKNSLLLNIAINVYFYALIFNIIFDLSMAIVYITHIKKALTKGMIARHSGWSVEMHFLNNDDFAGYLPMAAAAIWMRGLLILAVNIFSCKKINDIRCRFKKRGIMARLNLLTYPPLPDVKREKNFESSTLYYRAGEKKPYVHKLF